jgi:hypothetical protein
MRELKFRFHGPIKGAFYAYAYIMCTQYMYTLLLLLLLLLLSSSSSSSSSSSVTSYAMIDLFRSRRIGQDRYMRIKHMYLYEHILEASVPTMFMV